MIVKLLTEHHLELLFFLLFFSCPETGKYGDSDCRARDN